MRIAHFIALLFLATSGFSLNAAESGGLVLGWHQDTGNDTHRVELRGLPEATLQALQSRDWTAEQWQRMLSVRVQQKEVLLEVGLPSVAGQYRIDQNAVLFSPRFPLMPGTTYRAIVQPGEIPGFPRNSSGNISETLTLPERKATPSTVVERIYPQSGVLPENLLKFYLHFSAPMSRGRIYRHIHLVEAGGREVELPFLEIDEELWDPEMRRLTLFIDPGRIKREVRPLEEIGPALEQGGEYQLVIDAAWQDGRGLPLKEPFTKAFKVGPPDRQPPDPERWLLDFPKAHSKEPLSIQFDEPMDHALSLRMIHVVDDEQKPIAGTRTVSEQERRWRFTPDQPWQTGGHVLVIESDLEDLAGNSIGKPFEVDLVEPSPKTLSRSSRSIAFEVR